MRYKIGPRTEKDNDNKESYSPHICIELLPVNRFELKMQGNNVINHRKRFGLN